MGELAQRVAAITLDERTVLRRSPAIEHERETAITDLLKDNRFALRLSGRVGPFHLNLAIAENRLAMEIRGAGRRVERTIMLAPRPVPPHRQGLFPGLLELLRGDPRARA